MNTISSEFNFNNVGLILEQVEAQNIDILTMNEINVNVKEPKVRTEYMKAVHKKHHRCAISASWAPTTVPAKKYRPGGNQVTIFGRVTHRLKERKFDKIAGSWAATTIRTNKGQLTIISAYRVCQSSLTQAGPSTVYSQEHIALHANGEEHPQPRKRWLAELKRVIEGYCAQGHMILLILMPTNASALEQHFPDSKMTCP